MPIGALRRLCVSGSRDNSRRGAIFSGVMRIHRFLTTARIPGDLWINGSFLTEKTYPDDCDIVLRIEYLTLTGLRDRQVQAVNVLDAQRAWIKARLMIDLYIFIDYHLEHRYH